MNPVRSKKPEIPANSLKTNWTSNGMKIALPVAFLFLTTYFLLPTTVSASTIARPMANSGLVGYWSMEEGKGNSQTFDRSGKWNKGTLTNVDPLTDWVNSATSSGQALDFDGSDDYILVPNNPSFELTDGTISFWVKLNNWGSIGYNPAVLANRGASTRYSIHITEDKASIGMWNGTSFATVGNTFTPSQWYHVVFVESGSNTTVYINSVSKGNLGNAFGSVTGMPLHI